MFLGNCPPTPPLANINSYFSLYSSKCWLRGGVGGQLRRTVQWSSTPIYSTDTLNFVMWTTGSVPSVSILIIIVRGFDCSTLSQTLIFHSVFNLFYVVLGMWCRIISFRFFVWLPWRNLPAKEQKISVMKRYSTVTLPLIIVSVNKNA